MSLRSMLCIHRWLGALSLVQQTADAICIHSCRLSDCVVVLQVLHMVPMAESVQKLTAKCAFCGKAAPFTLRTVDDRQQEVVGGADKYQPVCRQHFIHC